MSQWPTSPVPIGLPRISSISPTLISTAQSLKVQKRTRGGQRWSIALDYANMTRAQWAPLWAFITALRGQYGSCTFVMPAGTYDTPLGTWATSGTIKTDGTGTAGARTVALKNFTNSQTGVVKAGDFLKLADSKVYMATADANSDGSGKATISIEPALIVAPAGDETVTYTSVPFTVRLAADQQDHSARPPFLINYSAQLVEDY